MSVIVQQTAYISTKPDTANVHAVLALHHEFIDL